MHLYHICKHSTANYVIQRSVTFKTMVVSHCCLSPSVVTFMLGTSPHAQTQELTARQMIIGQLTGTCYSQPASRTPERFVKINGGSDCAQ